MALSVRLAPAHTDFEGMAKWANRLGLFSAQVDPGGGAFLGNVPWSATSG